MTQKITTPYNTAKHKIELLRSNQTCDGYANSVRLHRVDVGVVNPSSVMFVAVSSVVVFRLTWLVVVVWFEVEPSHFWMRLRVCSWSFRGATYLSCASCRYCLNNSGSIGVVFKASASKSIVSPSQQLVVRRRRSPSSFVRCSPFGAFVVVVCCRCRSLFVVVAVVYCRRLFVPCRRRRSLIVAVRCRRRPLFFCRRRLSSLR